MKTFLENVCDWCVLIQLITITFLSYNGKIILFVGALAASYFTFKQIKKLIGNYILGYTNTLDKQLRDNIYNSGIDISKVTVKLDRFEWINIVCISAIVFFGIGLSMIDNNIVIRYITGVYILQFLITMFYNFIVYSVENKVRKILFNGDIAK